MMRVYTISKTVLTPKSRCRLFFQIPNYIAKKTRKLVVTSVFFSLSKVGNMFYLLFSLDAYTM